MRREIRVTRKREEEGREDMEAKCEERVKGRSDLMGVLYLVALFIGGICGKAGEMWIRRWHRRRRRQGVRESGADVAASIALGALDNIGGAIAAAANASGAPALPVVPSGNGGSDVSLNPISHTEM